MMDHAITYCPHDLTDAEIKHCGNVLSKGEALRNKRLKRLEHVHEHAYENSREENQRELVSGVSCTPLLLGYAQFGSLKITRITLIHHELQHRCADFHAHNVDARRRSTLIGATSLIKILKDLEHPSMKEELKALHDEDKSRFKFFKHFFVILTSMSTTLNELCKSIVP